MPGVGECSCCMCVFLACLVTIVVDMCVASRWRSWERWHLQQTRMPESNGQERKIVYVIQISLSHASLI